MSSASHSGTQDLQSRRFPVSPIVDTALPVATVGASDCCEYFDTLMPPDLTSSTCTDTFWPSRVPQHLTLLNAMDTLAHWLLVTLEYSTSGSSLRYKSNANIGFFLVFEHFFHNLQSQYTAQ
jgi:hypothetical protein